MPQLVFTHWEVLQIDPFWEPQETIAFTKTFFGLALIFFPLLQFLTLSILVIKSGHFTE